MKKNGIFTLTIGLIALFATLAMDTSVVSGSGRVYNIGLMNQQQNFLFISIAMAIIGAILWGVGNRNEKPPIYTDDTITAGARLLEKTILYEGERSISLSNYQLFLTKRFSIEKNSTLEKYVIDKDVFETLEDSLYEADRRYGFELLEKEERALREVRKLEADKAQRNLEKVQRDELAEKILLDRKKTTKKIIKLCSIFIIFAVFLWITVGELNRRRQDLDLEQQVSELLEMYSSGKFFGYSIGANNLTELSEKLSIKPIEFSGAYRLTCEGSQCDPVTHNSKFHGRINAVRFTYCALNVTHENFNEQLDHNKFILTGVNVLYGNSSDNTEIITLFNAGVIFNSIISDANQELTSNDLGVGLFRRKSGTGVKDICGNNES